MRVNVVPGKDSLVAYGDSETNPSQRYARTKEFMRLVRRLWTQENVDYSAGHFHVSDSTAAPRLVSRGTRKHPKQYFGGTSEAADRFSATEVDVQLFWGGSRSTTRSGLPG